MMFNGIRTRLVWPDCCSTASTKTTRRSLREKCLLMRRQPDLLCWLPHLGPSLASVAECQERRTGIEDSRADENTSHDAELPSVPGESNSDASQCPSGALS